MPPRKGGKGGSSFPSARIKKIMQSDEDVGKIGGSTPALVSKAVELFLQEMCQALENEARQKGTKKVTMYHIKRAVTNTPSLDFLKDQVAAIPDLANADGDNGDGPKRKSRGPAKRAGDSNGQGAPKRGRKAASQSATPTAQSTPAQPSSSGVAIPISSLLGPSDPDEQDDYDDDEEEMEEEKPDFTSHTVAKGEDDDYDDE